MIELNTRIVDKWLAGGMPLMIQLMELNDQSKSLVMASIQFS